jgi:hypothetical protein
LPTFEIGSVVSKECLLLAWLVREKQTRRATDAGCLGRPIKWAEDRKSGDNPHQRMLAARAAPVGKSGAEKEE